MTALERFIFVETRSGNIVNTAEKRLTLGYEGLQEIPLNLIEDYASIVETLDLSHNNFRHLEFLTAFENLTTLIVDHNLLCSGVNLPGIPTLTTLWLNQNLIETLHPFVERVSKAYPKLKFLSLMGNPAAPSYLNGGTYYEYLQYRLFVIAWLPQLEYLDDKPVTTDQRLEAKRLYGQPFYKNLINFPFTDHLQGVQSKLTKKLELFSWRALANNLGLTRNNLSIRNTNNENLVV